MSYAANVPSMKLLNFSIGQVQTVQIGTDTVRTAHVKAPVPEPWLITEDGASGDQRAVHPDKIYAYARTGYRHWGEYLKVDTSAWADGFFGENLTFDIMDEDELRVGDVFSIGNDVRLVVAGPRNVCVKLAWRLNQPPTFQKVFAQSHHTGVYLGVLNPGRIRPGETARRIEHDPTMPTIAEVATYIAGHATPALDPLRRLLAHPHLSPVIRHILSAKVDAAERAASAAEGRWSGWRPFVVERIAQEAHEIRSIYLRPADGKRICRPKPGQFVSVRMAGKGGEAIRRTWSLSAYAHDPETYRLTIRRQTGPGSRWMHRCQIGDSVSLRAPAGNFVIDAGGFRPVALVAAGIGITPLLAMLQAHLARGPTGIPIYLVYGARTPADQAFRDVLDGLAAVHPTLHITYAYSQSREPGCLFGRITADLLREILADLHVMLGDRRIAQPWFESETYICGPGDFCRDLKSELVARGANADHIFYELFDSAPVQCTELESADILFSRSKVRCRWTSEDDLSVLELAENAGVRVPSECRAGSCLSCRSRIIEGDMTSTMGDGSALLCIGRPKSPVLVLDC